MDAGNGRQPVIAVIAITALLAGAAVVSAVAAPKRRVILYGDSLAWEARDWFSLAIARGGEGEAVVRTYPGTGICDWLDRMRSDVHDLQPSAVVLEFVGNNASSCMQGPSGPLTGAALVERYRDDAHTATSIFAGVGVRVYWMGAPTVPATDFADESAVVQRTLESEANRLTFATPPLEQPEYVDAGQAVLDHGRFTSTLPCLPPEGAAEGCVDGRIQVRAPDGVHFCPLGLQPGGNPCPVYSSGATRFGSAMADPVRRDLGL